MYYLIVWTGVDEFGVNKFLIHGWLVGWLI